MFGWNCRLFCNCVCRVFLELRRVLLLARHWCASSRRTFFNCCLAEHVQRAEHLKSSTWVHFMWMNGTNKLIWFSKIWHIAIRLVDLETEKEISLWRNSGRKRGSSLFLNDCWDTWWHRGLPAGVVKPIERPCAVRPTFERFGYLLQDLSRSICSQALGQSICSPQTGLRPWPTVPWSLVARHSHYLSVPEFE